MRSVCCTAAAGALVLLLAITTPAQEASPEEPADQPAAAKQPPAATPPSAPEPGARGADGDSLKRPLRPAPQPLPQEADEALHGMGLSLWRYLGTMIFVCCLCIACVYLLHRLRGRLLGPSSGAGIIEVRQRLPLDARNSLVLVRVKDEDLLVGCGNGAISVLARYASDDQEGASPASDPEAACRDSRHPQA